MSMVQTILFYATRLKQKLGHFVYQLDYGRVSRYQFWSVMPIEKVRYTVSFHEREVARRNEISPVKTKWWHMSEVESVQLIDF